MIKSKSKMMVEIWIPTTAFIIFVFYDLVMSLNSFPITEGWWETYAWLDINHNIYDKFQMKMGPLNVLITRLLMSIFDGSFFYLKLAYITIHLISIILLYKSLAAISSREAGILGTVVAIILYICNPVYIVKDYHTVVELNLILAVFIFVYNAKSPSCAKYFTLTFVLGSFFLVKQNIALFFAVPFAIVNFLEFLKCDTKCTSKNFVWLIVATVVTVLLPSLIYTTIYGPDWLAIYIGNDSKGSIFKVLFRFVTGSQEFFTTGLAIAFATLGYLSTRYPALSKRLHINIPWICIFLLVCGLVLYPYNSILLFSLCLSWPILRLMVSKQKKSPAIFNSLYLLGLLYAYCGTMTAGYNAVGMELLIALVCAEMYSIYANENKRYSNTIVLALPIVMLTVLVYKLLFVYSYNWWGLKLPPAYNYDNKYISMSQLSHIKTDSFTRNALNNSKKLLDATPDAKFLATPSIPILYLLNNKIPDVPPVSWFDVSSSSSGLDIAARIRNKEFDVIAWLRAPQNVFDGHYKLIGRDPAQFFIDQEIIESIRDGSYKIVSVDVPYDKYINNKSSGEQLDINIFPFDLNDIKLIDEYCSRYRNGCSTVGHTKVHFKNYYSFHQFVLSNNQYFDSNQFEFFLLKRVK